MDLVGYSDSEASEDDGLQPSAQTQPLKDVPSKRGFHKVVDRSNPSKIKVNLPSQPTNQLGSSLHNSEEPPAKRNKSDRGGLSSFNAMLPAPKNLAAKGPGSASTTNSLRKGVGLRTGAAPAFTREVLPETMDGDPDNDLSVLAPEQTQTIPSINSVDAGSAVRATGDVEEPPVKAKAALFKPLSIARKPQKSKRKPDTTSSAGNVQKGSSDKAETIETQSRPKVSLFSTFDESDYKTTPSATVDDYQPTLYQAELSTQVEAHDDAVPSRAATDSATTLQRDGPSLDAIAEDLNLSASARRQLFGRSGRGTGANVVTFDTDAEYASNAAMRANQELQETRAPVRAIAAGKHSLRQLVNAAVGQKEALEESFASARRNKKEAGSKYGW